jgi:protein involved in polysaccharide export with SLBB domain
MRMGKTMQTWLSHAARASLGALAVAALTTAPAPAVRAQVPADRVSPALARLVGAVRPGDEIQLRIWREPELSGDFQVDESGVVVFPKIGPMQVTSEQPAALNRRLIRAYSAYLVNPSIQAQVRRRINVLGAVRNPGLYAVDPTITVADAISLAGGISPQGRSNVVEVRRRGETVYARLSGREIIGESPLQSGDQLFVPQRSWISRNPGVIIGALGLVSTALWRFAK